MVTAQFADIYHEMACILHHDGEKITSLKGEIIRFPTNLCPGAEKFIQELEGTSINTEFKDLYAKVAAGEEAQRSIDTNSQPDYREKLNAELAEMRDSEMWQTGQVVRKLRPENAEKITESSLT